MSRLPAASVAWRPLRAARVLLRHVGVRALFVLGLAVFCGGADAAVRAQFDRPAVREGDTVTLIIESDARSSDKPDLSPLGADFDVLGTSTSTQLNFINGHRTDLTRWLVQLQPRRGGHIAVAPIAVGGEQTAPLSLDVIAASAQAPDGAAPHVIVESEIGDAGKRIYVQQQVPYTVRLYYDDAMQAGDLAAPHADDAMIEKLGEDRRYTATRDGHDYTVIERRYAVAAEKSGKLVIPPVTFRGRVAAAPSAGNDDANDMLQRFLRNSPFANDPAFRDRFLAGRLANEGRPISARGPDVTLDVRPRPAGFTGHWLPAQAVTLHDSWSEHPPQFKVGEPVKRTITVDVKGLAASQIPQLDIAAPANARIYPETTDNQSKTDGSAVYGTRQQTITYIANAEGKLIVPPIELAWWNTQTDAAQRASLPQRSMVVLPGVAPPPEVAGSAAATAAPNASTGAPASVSAAAAQAQSANWMERLRGAPVYVAIAVAALAVTVIAWALMRRRRATRVQPGPRAQTGSKITVADALSELRAACAANDPAAALQAVLALAKATWPGDPPLGLRSLAKRLGGGPAALLDLERALYGGNPTAWRGDALWAALGHGLVVADHAQKREPRAPELAGIEALYR